MRKGDWIETYSGKKFWPLDPRPEDICVEDIAHGLSNMCRYNGQCKYFFSVAQHSLNCYHYAERNGYSKYLQIICLLHDAAEAYVSDVAKPLKPYLAGFKDIENGVQRVIYESLGLPQPTPANMELVKAIDTKMLVTEAVKLMPFDGWGNWTEGVTPDIKTVIYTEPVLDTKRVYLDTLGQAIKHLRGDKP